MSKEFPEYNQLNLSDVNKEMLKVWDEKDVFKRSLESREEIPRLCFMKDPLLPTECQAFIM